MFFYIYQKNFYWGRHQNLVTQRNVTGLIFRNKPAKLNHLYISGDYKFWVNRHLAGHKWHVHVTYKDGCERVFNLRPEELYQLIDGWCLNAPSQHDIMRAETRNAFRNRLNEYKGKYFLPFHKHARCM